MFGSRRVALAREALTSVTAWAELVVGPDRAQQLASDAVVSAASARGSTTLSELTRAARDGLARSLAHGECHFPSLLPLDAWDSTHPATVAAARAAAASAAADADADEADAEAVDEEPAANTEASAPYLPGNEAPEGDHEPPPIDKARHTEPEQDRRTPAERLADELAALRPHERLAAIRFYLDGESVDSIARLFDVARSDAVTLLESVTAVLAPIVGEYDLPDFAAEADEVEVVTR
ncbi:MAG: hypothetical protein CVT68_05790 [Actinobacteria bacterium HGW-Actinobacteria-8]|nr:MAG: hypothetical protein CVT68_05790 [Actinobacteria bacterium HGW-Actinobacteria-8]